MAGELNASLRGRELWTERIRQGLGKYFSNKIGSLFKCDFMIYTYDFMIYTYNFMIYTYNIYKYMYLCLNKHRYQITF